MTHEEVRATISAGEQAPEVERHLARCRACRSWAETLERVRALAPEVAVPPVPSGLADRAIVATRAAQPAAIVTPLSAGAAAPRPPWHRRVAGRLSIAAALIGAIAATAVLVPRDDAAAVLVASARSTVEARTARVEFSGTMTARLTLPEVSLPPVPQIAPQLPESLDDLRRQIDDLRRQIEESFAEALSGAEPRSIDPFPSGEAGSPEEMRAPGAPSREDFDRAQREFLEAQREFLRQARESSREALEAGRRALEAARLQLVASLPRRITMTLSMRGSGEVVFRDRLHVRGRVSARSNAPVPIPDGSFELIAVGARAWIHLPLIGGWAAMPTPEAHFDLTFKPGGILRQMELAGGEVRDLGETTLDGVRVRRYRVTGRATGPITGHTDLWIGVEDEILRRVETTASGSIGGEPMGARFSSRGSIRLYDFGAPVEVVPPRSSANAGAAFDNGAFGLGIGEAGLSFSIEVPGFPAARPTP